MLKRFLPFLLLAMIGSVQVHGEGNLRQKWLNDISRFSPNDDTPTLTFDPIGIYFGRVMVSDFAGAFVQITNQGTEPTEYLQFSCYDSNIDIYNLCPTTLMPGQSCQVRVSFRPKSAQDLQATMWVQATGFYGQVDFSGESYEP